MIRGLHHTSFTVSDVDTTERFFVEHLGMKRLGGGLYDFDYIRRTVGYADAVLKISILGSANDPADPHRLELIEYITPRGEAVDTSTNRAGAAHLAFVVDDIDAEYRRLLAAGVSFKSSPNEVTFGINRGAKAVYFNGPDGIALELLQPAKRSAPNA